MDVVQLHIVLIMKTKLFTNDISLLDCGLLSKPLRRVHMKLVVIRFRCASEANRIECALDAHQSRSHGTTGKQIRSELWQAWVS